MMPHEDANKGVDMIKTVLQKIIDEMTDMESQRMLPDGHPSKHVEIAAKVSPAEGIPQEESMESPEQENSEQDDSSLNDLLGKADSADENGAMPEDNEEDLHPALLQAIMNKKKMTQGGMINSQDQIDMQNNQPQLSDEDKIALLKSLRNK